MTIASEAGVLYGAFLTAQGRRWSDFFLFLGGKEESWLLDLPKEQADLVLRKLTLHKLRSQVTLTVRPDLVVWCALPGDDSLPQAPSDPRTPLLGKRAIQPVNTTLDQPQEAPAYESLRLSLGVPQGGQDLMWDKTIPLEANLDALHAISWTKGCYQGQELTARTHYRGLVRKRLIPFRIEGGTPDHDPQAKLVWRGEEVGTVSSWDHTYALARVRLEAVLSALQHQEPLMWGHVQAWPQVPAYLSPFLTMTE
jgi:folate-binding protein YgfZ